MPLLTIRHVTTYHYRRPVAFGEHRMMLRPRDSHSQKIIEANLEISPKPTSLRFSQDAFGNHAGIARFSGRAKDLCFNSTVRIEHELRDAADFDPDDAPRTFPIQYSADEMPDLAHCIERHQPDPGNEVARWAHQFLAPSGLAGAVELLTRLSHGINQSLLCRRREAKGSCGADDRVGARMAPPWQESPKRVRPPADTPADCPLWAFGGCQTWGFTSTAAGPSDAGSSRPSSETGIYPDAKPNRFAMGRSSG